MNFPVVAGGVYWVKVTDANDCFAADTVKIQPGDCNCIVSIPNAFTPNSDGMNDVWKLSYESCIQYADVQVYNRCGSFVFEQRAYQTSGRASIIINPFQAPPVVNYSNGAAFLCIKFFCCLCSYS